MDTVRLMVARLKRHRIPVILGGSHPTVLPEQSLNYTGADMAAVGEGESILVRVIDAIRGRDSFADIPSLTWRNDDHIVANPRGKLIDSVDDLPIPDRSFIDRSNYFGEVILTGRGCPFNCAYCASRNIWGRKVRLRSVSSIIAELKMLKEEALACNEPARPGRWVVKVVDDTFTVNKKRTLQLLDEVLRNG